MDAFHERLARVALRVGGSYGFCLAGGYAVQAHGMVDRRSEDVDLFTTHVARVPDAGFAPCGLKPDDAQAIRDRLLAWGAEITSSK